MLKTKAQTRVQQQVTFDSIKTKHEAQNPTHMPFEEFERKFGVTGVRDDFPDDPPTNHYRVRDFSKVDLQKLRKETDRLKASLAFRKGNSK